MTAPVTGTMREHRRACNCPPLPDFVVVVLIQHRSWGRCPWQP